MRPLALLGLACLAACTKHDFGPPPRPANVVLVVLDSVRADHLGAYGYSRETPSFDALAAEGVLFEHAYAASSDRAQSLSALWTGRLPSSGGSVGLEAVPHPELDTLPRFFHRAGYRTALVSNQGELRARTFTRGFDDVEVDSVPGRWPGELVVAKALELAASPGPGPLFLVVVLADASEPFLPRDEFRARIDVPRPARMLTLPELRPSLGKLPPDLARSPGFLDLVARYDAEIAEVDGCLGELVAGLRERKVLDDAALFVTSSMGTEFLEHGGVGHGWTLHEEVLRVPFLVCAPGRLAPGRVTHPVSLADVLPSASWFAVRPDFDPLDGRTLFFPAPVGPWVIVERDPVLAEVIVPELVVLRAAIDGSSELVDVWLAPPPAEREALLAGYDELLARVQRGELERRSLFGPAARRGVYELGSDPGERSVPAALDAALASYLEFCRGHAISPPKENPTAEDAGPVSELQQLGYL
jgi:hypothetical protein